MKRTIKKIATRKEKTQEQLLAQAFTRDAKKYHLKGKTYAYHDLIRLISGHFNYDLFDDGGWGCGDFFDVR